MPPKECPPGTVLNPKTNRCVKADGALGKKLLASVPPAAAAAAAPAAAPAPSKQCPPGTVLNPKTNRCVKVDGAVGKKLAAAAARAQKPASKPPSPPQKHESKTKTPPEEKLKKLHNAQMKAMSQKDIKTLIALNKQIEEVKKTIKEKQQSDIPDFLKVCIDPTTKSLPKVPTMEGDTDMKDLIKDPKQLILIDGLCYDIKSLFELIQVDIPQGNVWGINPYVKREGLILPFDKSVKPTLLKEGIKRGIFPPKTKFTDHTPKSADDKEMRGTYTIQEKQTPPYWMQKGWASDKTAFPTPTYYAITFEFPNRKMKQNPGRTVIFPKTPQYKEFIDKKLIPIYQAGALWCKKRSVTDGVIVISPNIHLVFEDNQPNRWYANKLQTLEEEVLKFAPAFN